MRLPQARGDCSSNQYDEHTMTFSIETITKAKLLANASRVFANDHPCTTVGRPEPKA